MDSEANRVVTELLVSDIEAQPKLSIKDQRKFEREICLNELDEILKIRTAAILRGTIGQLTLQLEKIEDGHILSSTLDQPEITRELESTALQFDPKIALNVSNEVNGKFSTALNRLLEKIRQNPVLNDVDKAELMDKIQKNVGGGFDYKM